MEGSLAGNKMNITYMRRNFEISLEKELYCGTCKNFMPLGPLKHKCPPVYYIYDQDTMVEEDADRYYAWSAESAIDQFSEDHYDGEDYSILSSEGADIMVKEEGYGYWQKYKVFGEAVVSYSCVKVESD